MYPISTNICIALYYRIAVRSAGRMFDIHSATSGALDAGYERVLFPSVPSDVSQENICIAFYYRICGKKYR